MRINIKKKKNFPKTDLFLIYFTINQCIFLRVRVQGFSVMSVWTYR